MPPFQFYPCPRCVHCGAEQEKGASAVIWYTKSSVSLTKCIVCNERRDPFVELDFPVISLELMLHRVPAFRHIICNRRVNISNWMRYASVIMIVEYTSSLWVDDLDPGWREAVTTLGATILTLASSLVLFSLTATLIASPANLREFIECTLRAYLVSRFPSLILLIAIAWAYPSNFYHVIAIYAFTCNIAAANALPDMDKPDWKCILVATSSACPLIIRSLLGLTNNLTLTT